MLKQCLAHVQQPTVESLPERVFDPQLDSFLKRHRGIVTMIAPIMFGLAGFAAWQSTTPPDIAGQWSGGDWGNVSLEKIHAGEYAGMYTDTYDRNDGVIQLKWSRSERRFKGTWREGDDRLGKISIRLTDDEIRGAWTTSEKSRINPKKPELADLVWRRSKGDAEDVPNNQIPICSMVIHVTDEDDQPIEDAVVFRNHVYAVENVKRHRIENADFHTDSKGSTVVDLSGTPYDLRIWVRKDGYVPLHAMWAAEFQPEPKDSANVPDEFVFRMQRGTEIGGIVVDESGKPVSGVAVEVMSPRVDYSDPAGFHRLPVGVPELADDDDVVADEQGRWVLNNVPSNESIISDRMQISIRSNRRLASNRPLVEVRLVHPEYEQNAWSELQLGQDVDVDAFRAKTATLILRSGESKAE